MIGIFCVVVYDLFVLIRVGRLNVRVMSIMSIDR